MYPQYIYLIVGIVFSVLFYGVIKNKHWAIDPESGYQRLWYNMFGRTAFRIAIGTIFLLGAIAGVGGFILYM